MATMLEKLGFQALVEETITCSRETRVMSLYKFVLGIVLGLYIGFPRLNQLRFIAADPMLTGILKEQRLPPQSTLWRFLAALHLNVAAQILSIQRSMRQRVWEAANIRLRAVTLDTDTTVHTLYGNQMGARKSYNPKNKGKKSYQPMLTFLAETREYLQGDIVPAPGSFRLSVKVIGTRPIRQIDIIKRGCTGAEMLLPIRRWRETFSGWPSSQAIVFLSLFGILQRRISFRDFLEFFLALGIFGNVRVILMGKFAIGFLDVIGRRETLDAQGLVVILEFHWKPVRSRMSTRPGTVSSLNAAGSHPGTSSHDSGVDTRASGVGRTLYADATVRSFAFWL